jgi:hypothetical protein
VIERVEYERFIWRINKVWETLQNWKSSRGVGVGIRQRAVLFLISEPNDWISKERFQATNIAISV